MNIQTLSKTLKDLDSHTQHLKDLSQNAKTLTRYFDWQVIAETHEKIWEELKNGG